jgi:hypothetical protein
LDTERKPADLDRASVERLSTHSINPQVMQLVDSIYYCNELHEEIYQLIDWTEGVDPDAFQTIYTYSEDKEQWLITKLAARHQLEDKEIADQFCKITHQAIAKNRIQVLTDTFPDQYKWSALALFFSMRSFDISISAEESCIEMVKALSSAGQNSLFLKPDIFGRTPFHIFAFGVAANEYFGDHTRVLAAMIDVIDDNGRLEAVLNLSEINRHTPVSLLKSAKELGNISAADLIRKIEDRLGYFLD